MHNRATLRGEAFGDPRLLVDGTPLVPRGAQRRRIVSLLLARSPKAVPLGSLADIVDPDARSTNPSNMVQAHIRRLRRDLEPDGAARDSRWLRSTDSGYVLLPDSLDLWEFRSAVLNAADVADHLLSEAAAALGRAIAMWDEPFGNLGNDQALFAVTRELQELRLAAEDRWCELVTRIGASATEVGRIVAYANAEPLREVRWELAMTALVEAGRQAEALRSYDTARRILRDELGVDPCERLRRMHQRVLSQDPRAISPTGADVATAPSALAALAALAEHHRLVTVTGLPGAGRSRLVHQWLDGHHHRPQVVWVEVPPQGHDLTVADALCDELGVGMAPTTSADPATAHPHLPVGEVVVVLHAAEHRIDEVANLIDALRGARPDARIVTTSTIALDLPGEHVLRLTPQLTSSTEGPGSHTAIEPEPVVEPSAAATEPVSAAVTKVIGHLSPRAREILVMACVSPDGISRRSAQWICSSTRDPSVEDPHEHTRLLGELVRANLVTTSPARHGSRYQAPVPVAWALTAGTSARSLETARAYNAAWISHLVGIGATPPPPPDPALRCVLLDELDNVVDAHDFVRHTAPADLAELVVALAPQLEHSRLAPLMREWTSELHLPRRSA